MAETGFPKRFDFREQEEAIYAQWEASDAFRSAYASDGSARDPERTQPFVICIPPPNITGRLHMGHALNNTVQDVLIRYKRMDGFDALWVPGTDHAGIATQTVVKKQLDAQGVDYRRLGREKTIAEIWRWHDTYGEEILKQLRRMGCSCDWSRRRFTMDEGMNKAVREAFVRLYEEGLIYRGRRIVNWCPVDQTALSDDEVEKADEKGKMYHIRYPFAEPERSDEHLVVATTRPETLFGDVAVAVHPEDPRFARHIGRMLKLPLCDRAIPVVGDVHANPEMGTGCVKITPAHDPNDFEVGQRQKLPVIDVMHPDATMNDEVPEAYRGLDRYACRAKMLKDLEAIGLLDSIQDHTLAIGRSYRSKVPIEFRLSEQWFVRMAPLAERALAANGYRQKDGEWHRPEGGGVQFVPERFEKVYFHWLSNIRDWCISRQIWWGHRIPAWTHKESGECLVARDTPPEVKADPDSWSQDPDVLDTWFSSWLWPMSTLGWPEKTPDFTRYYPTSVLSTAKDILFFWVARMNFAGLQFEDKLPFGHVYLHSTIADDKGVTMSKSKGNGIDPLTLIQGATLEDLKKPIMEARPGNMKELVRRVEKNFPKGFEAVGADAMRWTLVYSITEGEHVRLSLPRFTEGRNFVTKLWNGAGRIITALEAEADTGAAPADPTDEDAWVLARLDSTIRLARDTLERFDFGALAQGLYHFVWTDYCSWALELAKSRLDGDDEAARRGALRVMGTALADLLRVLHPIVPFVTEALWARLRPALDRTGLWLDAPATSALLIRDRFPQPRRAPDLKLEDRFGALQRFVTAVRKLRSVSNVKDNIDVRVQVKTEDPEVRDVLQRAKAPLRRLARLDDIEFVDARARGMAAEFDPRFEVYLDLKAYVDLDAECDRLRRAIAKTTKEIEAAEKTLSNPNFVERAPADKVAEARANLAERIERKEKLSSTLSELESV